MFRPHHPDRFKHWLRHTAMAPKGFLRYYVLKLLDEKPMSGSEIMDEIKRRTGYWRPSPGSIYPLLTWLQEKGYIKEAPVEGEGTKRFVLTEWGKSLQSEFHAHREEIFRRFTLMRRMWLDFYPGVIDELHEANKSLFRAIEELRSRSRKKPSQDAIKEAKNILEQAAESIEEIYKKLERE